MPMKDHKAERSDATQFIQPRAEYMDLKEICTEHNTKEENTHQVADYAPYSYLATRNICHRRASH